MKVAIGLGAHGGDQEYLVAPDDRTRVGQLVDFRLPEHAGGSLGVHWAGRF